ncbi:MAG: hypothetical protein F4X99_16020 [Gammaproteobacteria bacterium]|nr:hypothetical protein [Gammaproteobacteria bacterium]
MYVLGGPRGSGRARAGLQAGDVIIAVNRRQVANTREFFDVVSQQDGALALYVQRGNTRTFIAIR